MEFKRVRYQTHTKEFNRAGENAKVIHSHDICDIAQGQAGKGNVTHEL